MKKRTEKLLSVESATAGKEFFASFFQKRSACLVSLVLLAISSAWRGWSLRPLSTGYIYYVVDYSDGLIRRGLVGQIYRLFIPRTQPMTGWAAAVLVHQLICCLVIAGVLLWAWSVLWTGARFSSARLGLIAVIFLGSQFLPTMMLLTTYVDAYVFLLILAGFALAAGERWRAAASIGFIGPFIHEIFVLLWAPLALMVIWREGWRLSRMPLAVLCCVAPLIGSVVLGICESPAALAAQLHKAPLSTELRQLMAEQQMGHTLRGDLEVMAHVWAIHPVRAAASLLLFLMPTVAIVALARPALTRRAAALLALAAAIPAAVLLLEFDLSRFVTMTQFTTMLCVLFMAHQRVAFIPALSVRAAWLGGGFAAALFCLPLFYGYFDVTVVVGQGWLGGLPMVERFYKSFAVAG